MKAQLEAIEKKAFEELTAAQDLKDLDAVRVKYLGKKGELTAILKQMGKLSAEERPVIGSACKPGRAQIEERLEETKTNLEAHLLDSACNRDIGCYHARQTQRSGQKTSNHHRSR